MWQWKTFNLVLIALIVGWLFYFLPRHPAVSGPALPAPPAAVASPFLYNFNVPGTLEETATMAQSPSRYWWLDSGGLFIINDGAGFTNQGDLSAFSKWRWRYRSSNPVDSDDGRHPQNIFRLVTKGRWQNFSQAADFKINQYNLSASPNRNETNGLLFFLRYQDGDNLYYAGIRVDGTAVIKKKTGGVYHTLAQEKIFAGDYSRDRNPNLLPVNEWLGLKSEIETDAAGAVLIKLYLNEKPVLAATDAPGGPDGDPILSDGFAGIRTDFLDAAFREFTIRKLD